MKKLVSSGINLRKFQGQTLRLNKVYQVLDAALTVQEVKILQNSFLSKNAGAEDEAVMADGDYMDMDDLISALSVFQKSRLDMDQDRRPTGSSRRDDSPGEVEFLQRRV